MTVSWSAADIVRALRPPWDGPALMLQCYLDDSGTHGGAPVVVWGGVIGSVDQFGRLEDQWKRLLREPLPGKLPLKSFHLSHCCGSSESSSKIQTLKPIACSICSGL